MTKYQKIYETIKEKIASQEYAPNTYLPSEQELMKEYEASRDTVRKALARLAAQNYILKEKGKGSLVLQNSPITFPVSGLISFKELQKGTEEPAKTVVEKFEIIEPSKKIREQLNMKEGRVYHVVRSRSYGGEKVILDTDYVNADLIHGLTEKRAQDSIFEYIENDLELPISFARKEITVVPATADDKELLDLKDFDFLVLVRSYNYLEDATLFEYTESRHRPDKFRFVDFSRREK